MLADNSAQIILIMAMLMVMTIMSFKVAIFSKGEININSISALLPWLRAVGRRILTLAFTSAKIKINPLLIPSSLHITFARAMLPVVCQYLAGEASPPLRTNICIPTHSSRCTLLARLMSRHTPKCYTWGLLVPYPHSSTHVGNIRIPTHSSGCRLS